jgi:hypothetical protein
MAKQEDIGYWQLISQSMDLEDRRLRMFVRHKGSLGVGRETILRKFLADQTPEPLRISTGFVAVPARPEWCSDQCDVLVYDPRSSQPLYRIDEFVVVPSQAARLAIEVRSNMSVSKASGVDQVFKVHKSMRNRFPAGVFGFGFRGPVFETFVAGIASRVQGDIGNIPECIVVHRRNYICIRVERPSSPNPADKEFCLAMDFSKADGNATGFATALFLYCYHQRIHHYAGLNSAIVAIHARDMGLPHDRLWVIHPDGRYEQGFDPDKR